MTQKDPRWPPTTSTTKYYTRWPKITHNDPPFSTEMYLCEQNPMYEGFGICILTTVCCLNASVDVEALQKSILERNESSLGWWYPLVSHSRPRCIKQGAVLCNSGNGRAMLATHLPAPHNCSKQSQRVQVGQNKSYLAGENAHQSFRVTWHCLISKKQLDSIAHSAAAPILVCFTDKLASGSGLVKLTPPIYASGLR